MSGHYFKNNPNLKHSIKLIHFFSNGKNYRFYTDSGVFSKDKVDFGSKTLIEKLSVSKTMKTLLDLGSGYGPIGIVIKDVYPFLDVTQTDINERAISLCIENAKLNNVITKCIVSDGFENIKEKFDLITLNPPIRAGKEIVYSLYSQSRNFLTDNGELWLVIRKQQGALSHLKYLQQLFKNVEIITKNKGYFIIKCEKTK